MEPRRTLKISESKILRLPEHIYNDQYNESIKVIQYTYETKEKAVDDFYSLNINNYPNFFVLQIYSSSGFDQNEFYALQKLLDDTFRRIKKSKRHFIQLFLGSKQFNLVRESDGKYIKIKILECEIERREIVEKSNYTLNVLLGQQKLLLSDLNFYSLLELGDLKLSELDIFRYAINAKDELCYRILNLFDLGLDKNLILKSIVRSRKFESILVFFDVFEESDVTMSHIEEIMAVNFEGKSFFMLTIESRNLEILKLILRFYEVCKNYYEFEDFEKALKRCIVSDFFEIFLELKKLDFEGKNLLKNHFDKGDKILKDIAELYKAIEDENIEQINEFRSKHPLRFTCYKDQKTTAVEHAIDKKKFYVYAYLTSKYFYSNESERLNRRINNLSFEEKEEIRVLILELMKNDPKAFLGLLAAKFKFYPTSSFKREETREMLFQLSNEKELEPILKNISDTNVEIFFNFMTETINSMDPLSSEYTYGVTYYKNGQIYVGNDKSKLDRWGTFIHELMHFLLYLVYDNDCLPYCKDDLERETEWKKILEKLSEINDQNPNDLPPIIRRVFDYDENQREAELAVRVPHLTARYCEEKETLNEIREKFAYLFDFYTSQVLPDINIPNICQINELNNELGLLSEILASKFQVKLSNKNLLSTQGNKLIFFSNFPQLTFSSLCDEIKKSYKNFLSFKARNIFIHCEDLKQESFKVKLKDLIKTSEIDWVVVKVEDFSEINSEFLKVSSNQYKPCSYRNTLKSSAKLSFDHCEPDSIEAAPQSSSQVHYEVSKLFGDKVKIILVASKKNEGLKYQNPNGENYKRIEVTHEWNELTKEAKNEIFNQKIDFQGQSIEFKKILPQSQWISDKVFPTLVLNENLKINPRPDYKKLENNIKRTIQKKVKLMKNNEPIIEFVDLTFEIFFKELRKDRITVIADYAGSGKTFFLLMTHKELVEKFPTHWISFLTLKNFVDALKTFKRKNFVEAFIEITKLSEFDAEIFREKFARGEVKILFDGFDEISPECKDRTLEFFRLFKNEKTNQIFITTRTHLKEDLEVELDTLSYKLKIFSESEQVQVLVNCWKDPQRDEKLIEKAAKKLVMQLSKLISSIGGVIGIPLIVHNLGKIFKNKINKNFDESIEDLRISEIFREIVIEGNMNVLMLKFEKKCAEHVKKSDSITKILRCLAVKHLFDDQIVKRLDLFYRENQWSPEEIIRGGILSSLDGNEIKFNHRVLAEFLATEYCFDIIQCKSDPSKSEIKFIIEILTQQKFNILRVFLNDMLENFEEQNLKIFNAKENFEKVLQKNPETFQILVDIGLNYLAKFIRKLLESNSKFSKILEDIEELHENISKGNLEDVKKFTEEYIKIRLCYSSRKICALEHAIDSKKFDIYALLRAKRFYTEKQELLDIKIRNLKRSQKGKIRDENLKYVQKIPNAPENSLLSKIYFDVLSPLESDEAREMVNKLSQCPDIQPFFIHAINSRMRVVFSVATETIVSMDPIAGEKELSMVYTDMGLIYVGKHLNKFQRWGTFVHELTHYVLGLVYENRSLPYCEGDEVRKAEWREILRRLRKEYKENPKEMEPLIGKAFRYKESAQETEAAARVVDVVANYSENPEKLRKIVEKHKILFDFHRNRILPDLRIKKVQEVIKLNNKLGIFLTIKDSIFKLKNDSNILKANRIIFSSNLPQLTLAKIFEEIKQTSNVMIHLKAKNLFICAEELKKEKLKKLIESSEVERIILDCSKCEKFNFEFLNGLNKDVKIFIVKDSAQNLSTPTNLKFTLENLHHTFNELQIESQKILSDKNINFDGKEINLREIFQSHELMDVPKCVPNKFEVETKKNRCSTFHKVLCLITFCALLSWVYFKILDPLNFSEISF